MIERRDFITTAVAHARVQRRGSWAERRIVGLDPPGEHARYDFKTSVRDRKAGSAPSKSTYAKVDSSQRRIADHREAADGRPRREAGVVEQSPGVRRCDRGATAVRRRQLDALKEKLEIVQAIGCDRIVCPSTSTGNKTLDDYKRGVDNLRAGGELAKGYGVTLMLEFTKTSTLAGTLPSALKIGREANHPNARVMLDTFHFWAGASKFEDLELLRDGELAHLHFEDIPSDPPREIIESQ